MQLPLFPPAGTATRADTARVVRAGEPVPDLETLRARRAYDRLQRRLPAHLREEWGADHAKYDGYRLDHWHTPLVTDWRQTLDEAIDDAERLIVLYSLGEPATLRILEQRLRQTHRGLWPSLRHWHQHDPATAARWYDEYIQRHPDHRITPITRH